MRNVRRTFQCTLKKESPKQLFACLPAQPPNRPTSPAHRFYPFQNLRRIRGDCKAMAKKFGLPYRELSFVDAVVLMMGGLWKTGQEVSERCIIHQPARDYKKAPLQPHRPAAFEGPSNDGPPRDGRGCGRSGQPSQGVDGRTRADLVCPTTRGHPACVALSGPMGRMGRMDGSDVAGLRPCPLRLFLSPPPSPLPRLASVSRLSTTSGVHVTGAQEAGEPRLGRWRRDR